MSCDMTLQVMAGGTVHVAKLDGSRKLPFAIPLQIIWNPPSSGPFVDLTLGYQSDPAIKSFGMPAAGHAQFKPVQWSTAKQYEVLVSAEGGAKWRFNSAEIDFGTDLADVIFRPETPKGKAVLQAIADGKRIEISVSKDKEPFASETFTTATTSLQNEALVEAVRLVETRDPEACKPM